MRIGPENQNPLDFVQRVLIMDAIGLQNLISLYDKSGNTEICAISNHISTSTFGTPSTGATEITRCVTNNPIHMLIPVIFKMDTLLIMITQVLS